jgi:hypothetical protein
MTPEYPPYVSGYGGIPKLFAKIKEAGVPTKFTQDFVSKVLDLKSSSYRAMIPLMKRLGFVDQANVPTQAYKSFRDKSLSGSVMAERLRETYKPLFEANENIWKLNRKDLQDKLRSLLGAGEDDQNIQPLAGTFLELSKLAEWSEATPKPKLQKVPELEKPSAGEFELKGPLGLSYTINLNLPATTEIEVFNAIFKSLRENLLR